jgi:hypothetical protein
MKDFIKEHKELDKKRKAIFKKNQRLIAYWNSIPWWQFWKKPSFEAQRDILISNWRRIK